MALSKLWLLENEQTNPHIFAFAYAYVDSQETPLKSTAFVSTQVNILV